MRHSFEPITSRKLRCLCFSLSSAGFLFYALFLLFISLFLVNPQWDEYLDFAGCVGAANHLLAALRGHITDISTITSDLEWYGNAFRWPAYLLWSLQKGFPVQIQDGPQSYDHFLLSGFSSSIHITAVVYAVFGVYVYSQIVAKLKLNRLIGWASIFCLSLSPFWLSNATWNLKDLPVAVALLVVELLSLSPTRPSRSPLGSERQRFWIVSVILALVLSTKYAYLPLVILLSILYLFSRKLLALLAELPSFCLKSSLPLLKPICFCVVRNTFLQMLCVLILSLVFTPQVLGNPLYPLHAFDYFFRHPVVSINRVQSISFFASRLSYLMTPSFLVLAAVSCLGFWRFICSRRVWLRRPLGQAGVRKLIVCAFCLLPILFAVCPVLLSGRTFYGPDLRHVIWVYPPVLLFLAISADYALRSLVKQIRTLFCVFISFAILITFLELLMISPHFYSYLGVVPFHAGQAVAESGLVLSRYSPSQTPELHRDLLLSCARESACSSVLAQVRSSPDVHGSSSFSFPLNPSYYQAYLRFGGRSSSPNLFSVFGYSLGVDQSEACSMIEYGRHWPARLFSSLEICPADMSRGLK